MSNSISDQARINMLTALVLTEPQPSNVDLTRQVIDAGGLSLFTVTDANAAEHYNRYLITVRG